MWTHKFRWPRRQPPHSWYHQKQITLVNCQGYVRSSYLIDWQRIRRSQGQEWQETRSILTRDEARAGTKRRLSNCDEEKMIRRETSLQMHDLLELIGKGRWNKAQDNSKKNNHSCLNHAIGSILVTEKAVNRLDRPPIPTYVNLRSKQAKPHVKRDKVAKDNFPLLNTLQIGVETTSSLKRIYPSPTLV